jgi:hypothetical protein
MGADHSGGADGVRLVFGTLNLPDTGFAPRLLDRWLERGQTG